MASERTEELLAFDELIRYGFPADPKPGPPVWERPSDAQGERSDCGSSLLPPRAPGSPRSLAGCDEAGRGALAGPLAVGCVHLMIAAEQPPDRDRLLRELDGADDSKRLSPPRRNALFERIRRCARWGVGWASPKEIDTLGLAAVLSIAAQRAYRTMGIPVDLLLLDRGLTLSGEPIGAAPRPAELELTGGDGRSLHIACASIVAKVIRDRWMTRCHTRFPGYGFADNKGYGTKIHRQALATVGPSPVHRRSFCRRQLPMSPPLC